MMEIHMLELRKNLVGQNRMNDWIRLFNAESEGGFGYDKDRKCRDS